MCGKILDVKLIPLILFFVFFLFFNIRTAYAQQLPKEAYFKGEVIEITEQGEIINHGQKNLFQELKIKLDNGKILQIRHGDPSTLKPEGKLTAGEIIVVIKSQTPDGKTAYFVYDKYRTDNLLVILLIFVILVIGVAGLKGIGSLVGMGISLAVILVFIVPQILGGANPLLISIIGSIFILFASTYIAHGVSKQTTVALISTFVALFITATIAIIFTNMGKLTGIGNEDLASLQMGATSIINLKGLFLAGIIIGTLGALNDVTITQAATIFELSKTNKNFEKLVKQGFSVGKEHILSLVNTLVLAYAGSALFIFIFIVLNPAKIPYWVILNTETISGEIISTLAGSTGLILAVPIATLLAAYTVVNLKQGKN